MATDTSQSKQQEARCGMSSVTTPLVSYISPPQLQVQKNDAHISRTSFPEASLLRVNIGRPKPNGATSPNQNKKENKYMYSEPVPFPLVPSLIRTAHHVVKHTRGRKLKKK